MAKACILLSFFYPSDKERRRKARNKLKIKGGRKDSLLLLEDEIDYALFLSCFPALKEDRQGERKGILVPNEDISLPPSLLDKAKDGELVPLCSLLGKEDYSLFYPLLSSLSKDRLMSVLFYLSLNDSPNLTSFPLYIHRNTVIYRINTFKETTKLNFALFQDRMFVYNLIQNYLNYQENQYKGEADKNEKIRNP